MILLPPRVKSISVPAGNPDIAAQWHPTRNGALTPESVSYASHKPAWWLCPDCKHEWQTAIAKGTTHTLDVRTGAQELTTSEVNAAVPQRHPHVGVLRVRQDFDNAFPDMEFAELAMTDTFDNLPTEVDGRYAAYDQHPPQEADGCRCVPDPRRFPERLCS
jgi:Probable Zinc-ribbon domain